MLCRQRAGLLFGAVQQGADVNTGCGKRLDPLERGQKAQDVVVEPFDTDAVGVARVNYQEAKTKRHGDFIQHGFDP